MLRKAALDKRWLPLLNSVKVGLGPIYSKNYHSTTQSSDRYIVHYEHVTDLQGEAKKTTEALIKRTQLQKSVRNSTIDLFNPEVMQVRPIDIDIGKDSGYSILLSSLRGFTVYYGKQGFMPSREKNPRQMLDNRLQVPSGSLGFLYIESDVPFLIEANDPQASFAMSFSLLSKVLNHEDLMKQYSITKICELLPDDAKIISIELQSRIFKDNGKKFVSEEVVTSRVYQPTEYIRSSGTLMNFEESQDGKSKDMHYHPREIGLIIFTTGKKASANLNFCGVAESPDNRKDCEVTIDFPKNSVLMLNFPPYTYHKFYGDFVCLSINSHDKASLVETLKHAKISKGFLDSSLSSSTISSVTKENEGQWNLSMPEVQRQPENSRGNAL